jgi:predicted nucleotidyltransferase
MKREAAIAALRSESEAVKALGATSLYLFGSTVRDEAGDASDIDVFIEYEPDTQFSLIELVRIKRYLEERLGTDVDVTTRNSLHPLLRKRIESSAERIF